MFVKWESWAKPTGSAYGVTSPSSMALSSLHEPAYSSNSRLSMPIRGPNVDQICAGLPQLIVEIVASPTNDLNGWDPYNTALQPNQRCENRLRTSTSFVPAMIRSAYFGLMLIRILLSSEKPDGENLAARSGKRSRAQCQTAARGAEQDSSASPLLYWW